MNQEQFKTIVANAIEKEIEAFNFYTAWSEKAKDSNLKSIFKDLAADEQKHRLTLEGFMKMAPEKLHFSAAKDYKLVDALPTPPLTPDLKPVDGLVIAIKNELEAMQMYSQLANTAADEGLKKIFLELVAMERSHKSRLEDIYTNMAFPEVW